MASIREKLAALRAKRNSSPAPNPLIAHALTVAPNPRISWDPDYKARIRSSLTTSHPTPADSSSCSTDDSDDQLIVLPPPVRKFNSTAQRRLWRINQMGRAKEKAVKTMIQTHPQAFLPPNPPSLQPSPVSPQQLHPNAPAHQPDQHQSHHDHQKHEEWRDEEELALESACALQDDSPDTHSRHSRPTPPPTPPPQSAPTPDPTSPHHQHRPTHHPSHLTPRPDETTTHQPRLHSPQPPVQAHAACQLQQESMLHHSPPVARDTHRSADCGPSRMLGFIEHEAEDDDGDSARDSPATPECAESVEGDDMLADAVDDHEISPAEKQKLAAFHQKWLLQKDTDQVSALKADPRSMLDEEDEDVMASGFDDKVAKAAVAEEEEEAAGGSEAAEGDLEVDLEVDLDLDDGSRPANYIDSMFLRDDSRCQFAEDEENSEQEDAKQDASRRDKARALWKARQKIKADLFQEDENSLSRFDIFGDADHSRSAAIRAQLEGACRPASRKTAEERAAVGSERDKAGNPLKRTSPWYSGKQVFDGKGRSSLIHQEDRKRQRSVSIGRWSFSAFSEKPEPSSKPSRVSSAKASHNLEASYNPRKPRTLSNLSVHHNQTSKVARRSAARRSMDERTSFKGLFGALSARAESHDE